MAAEDLDLGPPCEDRRWQSNYSVCQSGWRPAISASCCEKDTRHSCNLKSQAGFKHGEKHVCFVKKEYKHMQICTQTYTRLLLHAWLLVPSLNSRKLWYCQVCAVYLSLKWSQSARISLKKQLGKIQGEQVHSSLPVPYPLTCVYAWAAQPAFFILFLASNYVWAYPWACLPFPSSTSVKFYLIDFQQFGFVNPPSLSRLAHCAHVRPCRRQSQLRDGWMKERLQGEGKKK